MGKHHKDIRLTDSMNRHVIFEHLTQAHLKTMLGEYNHHLKYIQTRLDIKISQRQGTFGRLKKKMAGKSKKANRSNPSTMGDMSIRANFMNMKLIPQANTTPTAISPLSEKKEYLTVCVAMLLCRFV